MGKDAEWSAAGAIKNSRQMGQWAEDYACAYLLKQKLVLIKRNYFCRMGELDLIMQDKDVLVFVEVRYRKASQFGTAAETITWHKQQKLIRAASFFLMMNQSYVKFKCRFDVISITVATNANPDLDILWIKDAFQVE